jgi:hypothetical protein
MMWAAGEEMVESGKEKESLSGLLATFYSLLTRRRPTLPAVQAHAP